MLVKDICVIESNNYQKTDQWTYFNYLDTGNIYKNNISSLQYIKNEQDLPSRAKQKVSLNDIIYSSVRPNQEHYGFIDKNYDNLLVSTGFIILKPITIKVVPQFLYYFLSQPSIVNNMQMIAQNSTSQYPSITKDDLLNIKINLPSIEKQKEIVSILKSIDNQIKKNNAMVRKLQVMTQGIYTKWFIQFDFPYAIKTLVYNEELKKEIPEGWKVLKLNDLLTKSCTTTKLKENSPTIDLSVMPSSNISLVEVNNSNNFNTNLNDMHEGYILFGSIRPYLKKCGIAPCDGCVTGTVYQFMEKIRNVYNYSLLTMSQDFFFDYALKVSKGTRMPVVSADDLLNYKLPYNKEIVELFNKIPIKKIILSVNKSTNSLIKLKNKLLPLLINGQLK